MRVKLAIFLFILVLSACGQSTDKAPPPKACVVTANTATADNILRGDLLYDQQWHLNNTGQSAFAENAGTVDFDLRLANVQQTGKGVVVNVVDTGLEIAHEDLKDNIATCSVNFIDGSNNPTNQETSGDHGTSVAGLIAAKAGNGLGGRGVAPDANLIAHNLLERQSAANFITSMLADADIVNQSFGFSPTDDIRAPDFVVNTYKDGVFLKRAGKGIIYIKAAGNGFHCGLEIITCENANMDPINTYPYNIVVGAINAEGIKSSYSTAGSAILVSGFGGEDGSSDPAMITTDQSGCGKGYDKVRKSRIPKDLDQNCNYTSSFNGTSSAAPVVSGVVALMLEANPDLTWRDVRHILVHTARKIDPTRDAVYIPVFSVIKAELGWTSNAIGLEFHNWYGFGLVDANSAVNMAKNYTANNLGNFQESPDKFYRVNQAIPYRSALTSSIEFTDDLIIESVQIDIKITHTAVVDLGIFLESPQGTTSLLFNVGNAFGDTDDLNMTLASQAFYGESAKGPWKLIIVDYVADDTGTLDEWSLKIYGHDNF